DSSKVAVGSPKRYDINTQMLSFRGPITGRMDFGVDLVHETMSGSSPWYVQPDTKGKPAVVMTGASISDALTAVNAHGSYYFDTSRSLLSRGYSTHDHYRSVSC